MMIPLIFRTARSAVLGSAIATLVFSTNVLAQVPGQPPAVGSPAPDPMASPTPAPDDLQPPPEFETITYWKAELPGGTYIVAHDSVNGVSMQEYILDGAARVTEVNISTPGVMQTRFYYIEPITPELPTGVGQGAVDRAKSAIEEAASRVVPGDPVWAKVAKTYPTTTHAGTIEYRIETKEQLKNLYKSAESSWIAGRSEIFRPEGGGKGFNPRELREKEEKENAANPTPNSSNQSNDVDAFSGGL